MHSLLYPYFVSCWRNFTADETTIDNAVGKGYLTAAEGEEIKGMPR